jgi:hypothetical protein
MKKPAARMPSDVPFEAANATSSSLPTTPIGFGSLKLSPRRCTVTS